MSSGETTEPRVYHSYGEAFPEEALILVECMRAAAFDRTDPISEEIPGFAPQATSPRWPSGVPRIDERLDGGFYGLTAIAGAYGVGKSMLALGAAIEAARAGWLVVYFNAEMPTAMMTNRFLAYAKRVEPELRDRFQLRSVNPTPDLKAILSEACMAFSYWPEAQRILVVLDSVNTIARMCGTGYWDTLNRFGDWAMLARKASEGRCAFLYVSEQNTRGDLKGVQLQFTADVVVNLSRGHEREHVEIDLKKSRESRDGNLGTFVREWHSGRFKPLLGYPVDPPTSREPWDQEPVL